MVKETNSFIGKRRQSMFSLFGIICGTIAYFAAAGLIRGYVFVLLHGIVAEIRSG